MNTQTLYSQACRHFRMQEDNERFSNDFFIAVNYSQERFLRKKSGRWAFLYTRGTVTTTASTATASLPSDFGRMDFRRGVWRITSPSASADEKLQCIDPGRYRRNEYTTSEGTPEFFWLENETLYLSPTPDAVYTIALGYYKKATEIESTNNDLVIPDDYAGILRLMVFQHLAILGYDSKDEISTMENSIRQELNAAAVDDVSKDGFKGFTLMDDDYTVETR